MADEKNGDKPAWKSGQSRVHIMNTLMRPVPVEFKDGTVLRFKAREVKEKLDPKVLDDENVKRLMRVGYIRDVTDTHIPVAVKKKIPK